MKTVFSVISPLIYSLICTHSVFVSSNKAAFFSAKNYDALEKKMILCLYFLRRSLCVNQGLNRCVSEEHECILFHLQSTRKPKQQPLLHLIIWMIPLGKGNNAKHHTEKVSSSRGVYVRKRKKKWLGIFFIPLENRIEVVFGLLLVKYYMEISNSIVTFPMDLLHSFVLCGG